MASPDKSPNTSQLDDNQLVPIVAGAGSDTEWFINKLTEEIMKRGINIDDPEFRERQKLSGWTDKELDVVFAEVRWRRDPNPAAIRGYRGS